MALKKSAASSFVPDGYKLPESSSYMKFLQGKNKFRILSSLVTGYEYWTSENKPVRSKTEFKETPFIKTDKDGKNTSTNHFWALVVWNYATEEVQTLEITQKGIQKYILGLVNDPEWGAPQGYDLVVTREGSGFETKYTTTANPHKELPDDIKEAYEKADIDLEKLFEEAE